MRMRGLHKGVCTKGFAQRVFTKGFHKGFAQGVFTKGFAQEVCTRGLHKIHKTNKKRLHEKEMKRRGPGDDIEGEALGLRVNKVVDKEDPKEGIVNIVIVIIILAIIWHLIFP